MAAAPGTEQTHVEIPAAGGTMPAFLCRPEGDAPVPAVLVVHEIFGPTPHIEDVTCRFAAEGYATLAPDLFWKVGAPRNLSDRASMMAFRGSIDDRDMLVYLDAAVAWLREQPFVDTGHIGIVGFCMGGYYAFLEAAHNDAITAIADFYGGPLVLPQPSETRPRAPMTAAADLHIPFLGLFGEEDQGIPVEQVRQLEQVLREAGVETEFHLYRNAGHAFHNDTGSRYEPNAARDAWNRTIAFFGRHLQPQPRTPPVVVT